MTLILPILIFALVVGLIVEKMTPRVWCVLVLWISLVLVYSYFKLG